MSVVVSSLDVTGDPETGPFVTAKLEGSCPIGHTTSFVLLTLPLASDRSMGYMRVLRTAHNLSTLDHGGQHYGRQHGFSYLFRKMGNWLLLPKSALFFFHVVDLKKIRCLNEPTFGFPWPLISTGWQSNHRFPRCLFGTSCSTAQPVLIFTWYAADFRTGLNSFPSCAWLLEGDSLVLISRPFTVWGPCRSAWHSTFLNAIQMDPNDAEKTFFHIAASDSIILELILLMLACVKMDYVLQTKMGLMETLLASRPNARYWRDFFLFLKKELDWFFLLRWSITTTI